MLYLIAGPLRVKVRAGVEERCHLINSHIDLQKKADQGKSGAVGQIDSSGHVSEHSLDAGRKSPLLDGTQVHPLPGLQSLELLSQGLQIFFQSGADRLIHR